MSIIHEYTCSVTSKNSASTQSDMTYGQLYDRSGNQQSYYLGIDLTEHPVPTIDLRAISPRCLV